MRCAILFFLISLLVPPAAASAEREPESPAAIEAANRLLKAEYELARKSQLYFIFDLDADRVRFKASGIAVAELPLTSRRLWGSLPPTQVRTVVEKKALFAPERQRIEIPDGEEKDRPFELQALELGDMPTSFRARFDDGTRLTVRSAPAGFFGKLWSACRTFFWYLTRPLVSNWHFLLGKPYTEVRLLLPSRDVQLLYWSLTEGASCLVGWTPSGRANE